MKIVMISDTHNKHDELILPTGDMLIHAGDATNRGSLAEVMGFLGWMRKLPFKHKIFIAGNHDFLFERSPGLAAALIHGVRKSGVHYLQDDLIELDGLRVYGSPWQPRFHDWAFNLDRGAAIKEKWDKIPEDLDVLITHGPPYGVLDVNEHAKALGCKDLWEKVKEIKPRIHVFGHIHEDRGQAGSIFGTRFYNACICDLRYKVTHQPYVVEL